MQLIVMAFYLLLPVGHLLGLRTISGNLAALGIGPIDLVEPAAGVSAALAAGRIGWSLVLGMAPLLLLALLLGPVLCSWICPWGLLSELLDGWLRRDRKGAATGSAMRPSGWRRPVLLSVLLIAGMVLSSPLVATLSAPRLITQLPMEVIYLGVLSPVTLGLILALLAIEVLAPRRIWCRTLCPVGTVANYLRSSRSITIRFDHSSCLCPTLASCERRCPWGLDPRAMKTYDGCTNCLACIDVCPSGSLVPGWGSK